MTKRESDKPHQEVLLSLFTAAGVAFSASWTLPNGYWPESDHYAAIRNAHPWLLVKTEYGLVKIGWRKRVIEIDWSDTAVRGVITTDDVTKSDVLAHAWSNDKAVAYLTAWRNIATEQCSLSRSPQAPTGDFVAVPRTTLVKWESWARVRGEELSPAKDRPSFLSDGLADAMKEALSAVSHTATPCPDGDACPDARRYGSVHPAPPSSTAPRPVAWLITHRAGCLGVSLEYKTVEESGNVYVPLYLEPLSATAPLDMLKAALVVVEDYQRMLSDQSFWTAESEANRVAHGLRWMIDKHSAPADDTAKGK